jgi:flagellar biosynthesis GTPase FlhF
MPPEVTPTTATEAFEAETSTTPVEPVPTPSAGRTFTAEDLERVREQEKSKLYPQLEEQNRKIAELLAKDEAREAEAAKRREARAAKQAEEERAAKEAAEAELSAKELLAHREQEWQAQLAAERAEREKAFALLQREREFQNLQEIRQQKVEAAREHILPELVDLISGNSPEEIDQSISDLTLRSNRIFEAATSATQQSRAALPGTRITAPASGPLDTNSDPQTFTPDSLQNMSMADYAKNRDRLLGAGGTNRGQGLFG